MAIEKITNEYGTFLYQEFIEPNQKANGRVIVFLHDQFDNPDIFNKFAEQLKFFDYYSIALPGDNLYNYDQAHKNSFNFTCKYVRDIILSLKAKQIYIIAHGTSCPVATFLANILKDKITKICLINPFGSKATVDTIRWISTLPRNVNDMYKVMQKMFYSNDLSIFDKKENSLAVINRMKNVFNYYEDIANYIENICLVKSLDEYRIYEENIKCPILLILGEDDKWIIPQEGINEFSKLRYVIPIQIPKAMHYPLHDQPDTTIKNIMSFFIENSGLYDENRLPNKYIYQFLTKEWKEYYRYSFSDKLNARDLEEYNKKMNEYEKSQSDIKFINDEYIDYINEYAQHATKQLDDIYNQAQTYYNQTKALEEQYNQQFKKTIQLDYNTPANTISINAQGYEVYHDGRGRGYYRVPNGDWKKIK